MFLCWWVCNNFSKKQSFTNINKDLIYYIRGNINPRFIFALVSGKFLRMGEFRCLQLFLFQYNCVWANSGKRAKTIRGEIILYTVYILASVAARTRQSQLHSFSLVVSKLMMESLTITCNIFTEIKNTAWNIENWKSFPSGV